MVGYRLRDTYHYEDVYRSPRLCILRESTMEFGELVVVAPIRRLDRSEILGPDLAFHANQLIRPGDDGLSVQLQPDVREESRPSSVSVLERVDPDRLVMKPDCLRLPRVPESGPAV